MSYLLDALNKSKGDQSTPSDHNQVPQPVMYPSYAPEPQVNIYKWISIILALVLTLIVGIVLGNKYALLGVPESKPAQTAVTPVSSPAKQPAAQQPIAQQPVGQTSAPEPTTPVEKNPEQNKVQPSEPTKVEPTNTQATETLLAANEATNASTQTQEQEEPEEALEGEPQVVGYQPESINADGKPKDKGLDDISNDLLSKFNQAILETEGTDESYVQSGLQNDEEVEDYLTRVPRVTELLVEQQKLIPAMVYETHLYSSDRFQRWVKINGRTMQETQWVTEEIQIIEIQKQFLILEMGHIRFSLPSLTDWPGYGK